jgi:hypothetical protein
VSLLCTLREPGPEEASRWHKQRATDLSVRMTAIADALVREPTAKLVKRTPLATELLLEAGHGACVRLTVKPDCIEARLGPFLVTEGHPEATRGLTMEAVSEVIEMLQVGSGFYVYSEELIGFDPAGACPSCGMEVFEWQDRCEICDATIHAVRPGEDEHDGHAHRVVDVLLRRKMIELASPRGRRNVEKTVSVYFAYEGEDAAILLGLFMDMADLAEVYCDEHELGQVLRRIR